MAQSCLSFRAPERDQRGQHPMSPRLAHQRGGKGTSESQYFFLPCPFPMPRSFPVSCIHLSNIKQSWVLQFKKVIRSMLPAPRAAGGPRCIHPALRRWHRASSRLAMPLYGAAGALGAFLFSLLLHFHPLKPLWCSILGGRSLYQSLCGLKILSVC